MRTLAALSLLAAISMGGEAAGDGPKPFPDFSAKRVKVPSAGARRITVQIDPAEQAAAAPVALPEAETTAERPANKPLGRYSWFWDKVSPDLTEASPARLEMAMNVLSVSGEVTSPRLQDMQGIARRLGIDILKATLDTSVSPALVLAVITVESQGKVDAVSSAGAQGLMQLMPDTARRFGVTDSLAPDQNIAGGVRYLDWLMGAFNRDPILVLAGYNAGEGSVRDHAGVPPFAETRDYVPKVLAAFQIARGLCITPPELITDGCVFAAMN